MFVTKKMERDFLEHGQSYIDKNRLFCPGCGMEIPSPRFLCEKCTRALPNKSLVVAKPKLCPACGQKVA